jgi:exosortase E/protease (VPEID-CTERM system)
VSAPAEAAGRAAGSRFGTRPRLLVTVLLLACEFIALTLAVDLVNLRKLDGVAGLARAWGPWALRFLLISAALTTLAATARAGKLLKEPGIPMRAAPVALHFTLYGLFCASSVLLVNNPAISPDLLAVAAVIAGFGSLLSGGLVLFDAGFWKRLFRAARYAPLFGMAGAGAALAALWGANAFSDRWLSFTFDMSSRGLGLVARHVVSDRGTFILGTPSFQVRIAAACSGFEGLALMLAFGGAWLWFFRSELRFPRALLLLPAGLAVVTVLNWVRIVALILIGSAGAPAIATGGFHSQAGWIGFMSAAILFSMGCQRISWFAREEARSTAGTAAVSDDPAPYLMPFLAILGTGVLVQAASAGFEWLYPVRVLSAAAAFWWFRRSYAGVDWKVGWEGPAAGLLVFGIWIGIDRLTGGPAHGTPAALAAAPPFQRVAWLVFRVIGGVLTVPVAEELAFRGYLLRRLISPAFTSVEWRRFSWLSFTVSAAVFGALHGRLWFAGIAAGMIYALAMLRRGRMGDAIAAHAATNLLLALWVLFTGEWRLW